MSLQPAPAAEANQAPVAAIAVSAPSGTAPADITFAGSGSTGPSGDQLSYRRDFGDSDARQPRAGRHR